MTLAQQYMYLDDKTEKDGNLHFATMEEYEAYAAQRVLNGGQS